MSFIKSITSSKLKLILVIIGAVLILAAVLLLILWPTIRQGMYDSAANGLKEKAESQLENIKNTGVIKDEDSIETYFTSLQGAINVFTVEADFNKLNEDYSDVELKTADEIGISEYIGLKDKIQAEANALKAKTKEADSIKAWFENLLDIEVSNDNFQKLSEETFVKKGEIINIINGVTSNIDCMSTVEASVEKIFTELKNGITIYDNMIMRYINLKEAYDNESSTLQSIKSWTILRDNAPKEDYKQFCQQKIDEFTATAASGIQKINEDGKAMNEMISSFEASYGSYLNRIGQENMDYAMKAEYKKIADNASSLVLAN